MNRVFILGSGFSAEAGAPISKTVLPRIFSPKEYRPKISELKCFLDNFLFREETNWVETTSLEEILSRLDLIRYFRPYSGIDYNRVSHFEELLLSEFTELLFPGRLNSRKPAYRKFASKLDQDTTVISFNYDLLVENIIQGENKIFDYCFQTAAQLAKDKINLLKLHGSVNTYYCPFCQNIVTFSPSNAAYKGSGIESAGENPTFQLTCNLCKKQGRRIYLRHFIIAPTLFKSYSIPALRNLWFHALRTLTIAEEIIFIGYSLPEADILSYQLFDFSKKLAVKKQSVVLVNGPRADAGRFQQIYGPCLTNTGLYFKQWVETDIIRKN